MTKSTRGLVCSTLIGITRRGIIFVKKLSTINRPIRFSLVQTLTTQNSPPFHC